MHVDHAGSNSNFILQGVVFEDTPAGIRSGKAAGCKTIGFLTTHRKELMEAVQPDFLVPDMERLVTLIHCSTMVLTRVSSSVTIRPVDSGLDITVTTE